MKKLSLLFAVIGIILFASCCENDTLELDGTTWKANYTDGSVTTLSFTATHATYHATSIRGNDKTFTGTYLYDPPRVVIDEIIGLGEHRPITLRHEGTVKGKNMTINISRTFDLVEVTELRRQ